MTESKPDLVLLHGVTMSGSAWSDVIPLLSQAHRVHTPTALGHRGGAPAPARRPVTLGDMVDDAERILDDLGLDRPHLAGNSMGGWMSIELARRGRAASVCALSPAGMWSIGSASQDHAVARLRREVALTRVSRPIAPLALKLAAVRRIAMRDIAWRADRLTPAAALTAADDLLGCAVTVDLLGTREHLEPLDPVPCPITVAWGQHDRIFPVDVNGAIARDRIPQATFTVLARVGHVPMIDDPALVADTIIGTIGAARSD